MTIHRFSGSLLTQTLFEQATWPLRRSAYQWGATFLESGLSMPGDVIVRRPRFVTTRAISIQATPADVWPQLLQICHNRVGFYNYELAPLVVARTTPDSVLVLKTPGYQHDVVAAGNAFVSWAFILRPMPNHSTRLVVRYSADYPPTLWGAIRHQYLFEMVHFLMERRMLRGIQSSVEAKSSLSRNRLLVSTEKSEPNCPD